MKVLGGCPRCCRHGACLRRLSACCFCFRRRFLCAKRVVLGSGLVVLESIDGSEMCECLGDVPAAGARLAQSCGTWCAPQQHKWTTAGQKGSCTGFCFSQNTCMLHAAFPHCLPLVIKQTFFLLQILGTASLKGFYSGWKGMHDTLVKGKPAVCPGAEVSPASWMLLLHWTAA